MVVQRFRGLKWLWGPLALFLALSSTQLSTPFIARFLAPLEAHLEASTAFAQASPHRRLVIGTQVNNPPYEYLDEKGRPAGFTNDLIRVAVEKVGMEPDIRPMLWGDIRTAFEQGTVDAVAGMSFSEDRVKIMDFSIPIAYVPYVLITRKGDKRIRSEGDLVGKEVLVLGKSIMSEHLDSMGIPFRESATHEESILRSCLTMAFEGEPILRNIPNFVRV